MKKSLIYTRTGDKGKTCLVGGARVAKNEVRLEAYGTVDELNAHVGVLITYLTKEEDITFLQSVQNVLFNIGANLATDTTTVEATLDVTEENLQALEHQIDVIDEKLPPLKAFVLPGGARGSAVGHVCRTVCRRTERRILSLNEEAPVSELLMAYINRLSDYFFVLCRKINFDAGKEEIFWNSDCK